MYALYDEQKKYVKKLRIIFNGFYDYLSKEKDLSHNLINKKMEAVHTYLQEYHLGYSEVGLSELDSTDFTAFFEYFVAKKWFGITKSEFKALSPGLKSFVEFLKEKLNYYQKKSVLSNIIKSLNPDLYHDLIFSMVNKEDHIEDDSEDDSVIESIFVGEMSDNMSITEFIVENIDSILATKKIMDNNSKKDSLKKSIKLKINLNKWYTQKEINLAEKIQEDLFTKYSKITNLKKNELLAEIDYTINDIFKKGYTQKQIAQRNRISVGKLTNFRSLLSPYIPIEYFYPNYLSGELIEANLEKSYIFKINSKQYRNFWAKFELLESHTLDDLHDTIQDIMDFSDRYEGHLYSFFLNGKEWDSNTEYASPIEFQDVRNVKKTTLTLNELSLGYKQKFLYIYDYAESVKINIVLINVGIQDKKKKDPHIIRTNAIPQQKFLF